MKAKNFEKACRCFELVIQEDSVSPEELAKANLLLLFTRYKLGIRALEDQNFSEAATVFGKALKERPDSFSKERLQKQCQKASRSWVPPPQR